jgi:rhomboid protease GluP
MIQVDKRRMCPNCRAFITTDDKVCPYCEAVVGPRVIEQRSPSPVLGGLIPHARFITVMILLINTGLYIATVLESSRAGGGFDPDARALVDFGAKYNPLINGGQWWRLLTAGFLHGGVLHILMNSWVLFDLGTQIEETFGTSRYLVLYFTSTITGFLASYYWSPAISMGASAGIMGLIGAMIAHGVRERSAYGTAVRNLYMRWAFYVLLMGLLPFGIDNAAHIGGLAGGFIVGYITGTPGYSRTVERFWQIASGIALAMTVAAFSQMFLWLMSQQR